MMQSVLLVVSLLLKVFFFSLYMSHVVKKKYIAFTALQSWRPNSKQIKVHKSSWRIKLTKQPQRWTRWRQQSDKVNKFNGCCGGGLLSLCCILLDSLRFVWDVYRQGGLLSRTGREPDAHRTVRRWNHSHLQKSHHQHRRRLRTRHRWRTVV